MGKGSVNRDFYKEGPQMVNRHKKDAQLANQQGNANQTFNEILPYTCQNGYY